MDQVHKLSDAKQYQEALVALDALLARSVPVQARASLVYTRRNLAAYARLQEVRAASVEQRWSDARRLLEELLAGDTPSGVKNDARQRLADMDRRNLGRN